MHTCRNASMLVVALSVVAAIGCASDARAPSPAGTCPPDYPVARDGACYRADGGAPPSDASTADGAADGGDGAACVGAHPLFDATRRWCSAGHCYCGDVAMAIDVCYAAASAVACCPVMPTCY